LLAGTLASVGSETRGRLSARQVFFSFAGNARLLVWPIVRWHVSKMLFSAREHLASHWLDLAEGRLRLDRLNRNGGGETFFPWASPIPREARKSHRRHPPLRSGPRAGASSIASGLQIAIEAAMVAGSNSKGEVTWLTSVPSRSPATSTRATS
jgi:hypothetical protein